MQRLDTFCYTVPENSSTENRLNFIERAPKERKSVAWSEQLNIRATTKHANIDATLPSDKSIYQYLKTQNAYQPEEWCYTQMILSKLNEDESILPYALTMRKLTSKHLLKEYEIQKKDIRDINTEDLTEKGLDIYDTLTKVLKAFEIEIERRGLDNEAAAQKALNK